MKKALLAIVFMAGAGSIMAQSQMVLPNDKQPFDKQFSLKVDSNLLVKPFLNNTLPANSNSTELLNKLNSNLNLNVNVLAANTGYNMPIARFNGNSKMPVVVLQGNSKMPVVGTNNLKPAVKVNP